MTIIQDHQTMVCIVFKLTPAEAYMLWRSIDNGENPLAKKINDELYGFAKRYGMVEK